MVNREWSPMREVQVIAKLADLSEAQYGNALLLHALIDLLVQKGVVSREELAAHARRLDDAMNEQIPGPTTNASSADGVASAPHAAFRRTQAPSPTIPPIG